MEEGKEVAVWSEYPEDPSVRRSTAVGSRETSGFWSVRRVRMIGSLTVSLRSEQRTDEGDRVCKMARDSENKNLYTDKGVSCMTNANPPDCKIMDTVGAEHTRKSSEILYMSVGVSRPKWINWGGARERVFTASPSTSNNNLLSSPYCSFGNRVAQFRYSCSRM